MKRDLSYLKDCPIAILGAGAVGMTHLSCAVSILSGAGGYSQGIGHRLSKMGL